VDGAEVVRKNDLDTIGVAQKSLLLQLNLLDPMPRAFLSSPWFILVLYVGSLFSWLVYRLVRFTLILQLMQTMYSLSSFILKIMMR
jgi:hypothetical protein